MTKYYLLSIMILAFSQQILANVDYSDLQSKIKVINQLEEAGQHQQAAVLALEGSVQTAEQIGLGQVVANANSVLNEARQEIVENSLDQGASASILFGLLSGSFSKHTDVTKIVTANPSDVAGFSKKVSDDFMLLKSALRSYVKENELALFYVKVFAAKAAQLTQGISLPQLQTVYPMIQKTIQQAQQFEFTGMHSVAHCITTQYAKTENGMQVSLSGLLISGSYGESAVRNAFSETQCNQSVRRSTLTQEDWISARLLIADAELLKYANLMELRLLIESTAPFYPTWGLPSMNEGN